MLHIVLDLQSGGLERLVADLVRRVDPGRFECSVLAIRDLGRYAEQLDRFATLHVAEPQSDWSMLWPRRLACQIRTIAPDVVHTHSGVWYKASLAARLAGVRRVVHTDHGRLVHDPWHARLVDGFAARRTDVVVAVSQALADRLAAGVVRDVRRIRVITNGVDTAEFRPRPDHGVLRDTLGIALSVPIIGSVGRFDPIKGYDLLLRGFAVLRQRWSWDRLPILVIAGEGPEREPLLALARDLAVWESVRILEWRKDVENLYAAFTVFTLGSRSEGTSMSLLEAMSAGLCPVVTNVGGNAAVLGPALAHRLVPPGDPAALADAWIEVLRNGESRQRDGQAARSRVEAAFRIETMVRHYEGLYAGNAC